MQYVHLAGTNAKGSTAQYIADIISVNHLCGLFTSPHIISPRERMKINGEEIGQTEYETYMEHVRGDGNMHLFCVWTHAALAWFRDKGTHYAVMETGLGGRCDPTNIVPSKMQVITPISYDHMAILGNTLTAIAREKCGIIKDDSIVISHPQEAEALRVIRQTCRAKNARLVLLNEKEIKIRQSGTTGQRFDFSYEGKHYRDLHIHAVSPMQVDNACVALIAAAELGMGEQAIREGLSHTVIPARVQVSGNVIIDGAHNPAALAELKKTVQKYYGNADITVLTAIMRDKDVFGAVSEIEQFADRVICTCANKKRGTPAKELAGYFTNATSIENPDFAFEEGRCVAGKKKGILVVCGSFYLASFALRLLAET